MIGVSSMGCSRCHCYFGLFIQLDALHNAYHFTERTGYLFFFFVALAPALGSCCKLAKHKIYRLYQIVFQKLNFHQFLLFMVQSKEKGQHLCPFQDYWKWEATKTKKKDNLICFNLISGRRWTDSIIPPPLTLQ